MGSVAMWPFLAKTGRGGYPLWLTYWVIGVGGNMALLGVLALAWLATAGLPVPLAGARLPPPPAQAAMWAVWTLGVAWHAFTFRAVWRAGAAYAGWRGWPWAARAAYLLGYPRLALEALFLAGALF